MVDWYKRRVCGWGRQDDGRSPPPPSPPALRIVPGRAICAAGRPPTLAQGQLCRGGVQRRGRLPACARGQPARTCRGPLSRLFLRRSGPCERGHSVPRDPQDTQGGVGQLDGVVDADSAQKRAPAQAQSQVAGEPLDEHARRGHDARTRKERALDAQGPLSRPREVSVACMRDGANWLQARVGRAL